MDFISELTTSRGKARGGWKAIFQMSPARRREAKWALFFISPWLIGFLLFYLAPMIASIIFSFHDFILSAPDEATYVGLANWQRMLFEDPKVGESLIVTFKFAFISLPIGLISSFMLAILLNSKNLIGRNFFRTLFYAPTMVPLIAAILIWSSVLNPHTGWINRFIELFGVPATGINGIRWLDDPQLIYIAYTFIGLYGIGNTVLIFLASLQGVPT
ncbi:MAG: sugar ABC transporter permease, partial [Chloroflexi bacterium]